MTIFEKNIPAFLINRKNLTNHALFTGIFALVFINYYAPFGVETWYNVTKPELLFYSSLFILAGLAVIACSRIIMFQTGKRRELTYGQYALWIATEIASMALVYVFLERLVLRTKNPFVVQFKESLITTTMVLLLPYTVSWLYFSWLEKKNRLEELSGIPHLIKGNNLLPFRDEKGTLRFSVKKSELLYLEAADNYVVLHYIDSKQRAKYMIRNSLKQLEADLNDPVILRCHRSYVVNFDRVKLVRKEKDGLVLELDVEEKLLIPISKTYVDQVMQIFSQDLRD